MPVVLALGTALIGIATVAAMARSERQERQRRTSSLLDDCRGLFESSRIGTGADGFPRLDGVMAGRKVRLRAIPDTLTLKRLPQLWLSVTLRADPPIAADLAVLARPTGAECFSIAQRLCQRLALPALLSGELLARGSTSDAQGLLDRLAGLLSRLFANPKVKEVAATRQGLRVVYQIDQGKRGDYLLLRQSVFVQGRVDPATVLTLLDRLLAIEAELAPEHERIRAAAEHGQDALA